MEERKSLASKVLPEEQNTEEQNTLPHKKVGRAQRWRYTAYCTVKCFFWEAIGQTILGRQWNRHKCQKA